MNSFQYENKTVSESAFETVMIRQDRKEKRLFIIIIILIIAILLSNMAWFYAWQSYDYVSEDSYSETVNVDGKDGTANYIGNNGDIVNGENNSNTDTSTQKNPPKENR